MWDGRRCSIGKTSRRRHVPPCSLTIPWKWAWRLRCWTLNHANSPAWSTDSKGSGASATERDASFVGSEKASCWHLAALRGVWIWAGEKGIPPLRHPAEVCICAQPLPLTELLGPRMDAPASSSQGAKGPPPPTFFFCVS